MNNKTILGVCVLIVGASMILFTFAFPISLTVSMESMVIIAYIGIVLAIIGTVLIVIRNKRSLSLRQNNTSNKRDV